MIKLNEKIALLTDIHANEEALTAIINDAKKRNIKHIISLGDLVGVGPNPSECIDLAVENNIINTSGNNDYYNVLPFDSYRHLRRNPNGSSYQNAIWTKMKLNEQQIDYLRKMPPSIDIEINNKLIALCHFPCDCRYFSHSVWTYEDSGPKIFYTTNTSQDEIYNVSPTHKGRLLAEKTPIFDGKTVNNYDAVIFGHYHFEKTNQMNVTTFLSLNGSGVAIKEHAIYYILEPKENGYGIDKIYVPYDTEKLYKKLDSMDYPKKQTFELFIHKK